MRRRALLLAWLLAAAAPAWSEAALEECRDDLAVEGPTKSVSLCYFEIGWEDAELRPTIRQELEEVIERFPSAPWPNYYRGRLPPWWVDGLPFVQRAADLFAAAGDVSGEIRARAGLVTLLGFQVIDGVAELDSGFAAAEAELSRLQKLRASSPFDEDDALVFLAEAHLRMFEGTDLGEAYSLLLDAAEILEQAPAEYHADLKECYRSLLEVTIELDVPWGPTVWSRKAEAAALAGGSLRELAAASHNVVEAIIKSTRPDEELRSQLIDKLHQTLEIARASGHGGAEGSSLFLLAALEGGPERRSRLTRCREVAEQTRDLKLRSSCVLALATDTLDSDPAEARRLLEQAHPTGGLDRWTFLDGWPDQMRVLWETAPLERALEHGRTILDAIENLRRRQAGQAAELLLSEWADPYYWMAGRLLQDSHDPDRLRHAFALLERLRAQTLREALASETAPGGIRDSDSEQWQQLDRAYVEVFRELLNPALTAAEREALKDTLSDLERREAELERRHSDQVTLEPPAVDLLDQVGSELEDDQALLSYQLGLWEGWDRRFLGGSWLTVTTREGTRVYPLSADAATLGTRVRALLRLEDPDQPAALARLYGDLMASAIAEIPPETRRLVIVPDGFLHLLPFALLRNPETGRHLADRFEIHIVPSATVWLDWKRAAPSARVGSQTLVLANPLISAGGDASFTRGDIPPAYSLGQLPFAEREGRRVLRQVGGRGRLEAGAQASEEFLKHVDLGAFNIVHFAAHAISDPTHPGRSAILLAPGAEDEDGFLRPPEIARLQGLDGKFVVLAACDTAAGNVLRGEGALSLGRAFFEAGARSVLASLWRLDDRLATEFFDDFYGHLRHGVSVGSAFSETQRAWSAAGRPASVWGGLVLLGDGDFVPLPGGAPRSLDRRWLLAMALALLVGIGATLLAKDSRERRGGGSSETTTASQTA